MATTTEVVTKSDLIDAMAEAAEISKAAAEAAFNAFTNKVMDTLSKGREVAILGFGNWKVNRRAARVGRNPQTGAEIQIPEANVPKFKAGKKLKDAVNKK